MIIHSSIVRSQSVFALHIVYDFRGEGEQAQECAVIIKEGKVNLKVIKRNESNAQRKKTQNRNQKHDEAGGK